MMKSVWISALMLGLAEMVLAVSASLKKDDEWFRGEEARMIYENVLSHQADSGAWPKNIDTGAKRFDGRKKDLHGTYDNGATVDEIRFLARYFKVTNEIPALKAVSKGLRAILEAQYENGGWPQSPSPGKGYGRHITFNDGTMIGLMELMREVASSELFSVVSEAQRKAAEKAFERGVGCLLKCQIKVDGKLTVWCAQHDEVDFRPRPARSYELVSLSGCESVGIVRLLMSLDDPSPEIKKAIEGAVAWMRKARIEKIKVVKKEGDRVVVNDPEAPGLWARFYDVKTNKPMFSDRDGVVKGSLAEIGHERRNGYAWYGNWPASLLEKEYPEWKTKGPGR